MYRYIHLFTVRPGGGEAHVVLVVFLQILAVEVVGEEDR